MRVSFKKISGMYAIGECGVIDLENYEELEDTVENRTYNKFDKRELFWTIYDQIILPTRKKANANIDHTFRLLYIEDDGDTLVFHYNIDDYEESYCEVPGATQKSMEEVISVVYKDFYDVAMVLPDDNSLKESITWDKNRQVSIPGNYVDRLKSDVFYSCWIIDDSEQ